MKSFLQFLKDWTLILCISIGCISYLTFHYNHFLNTYEPQLIHFSELMPPLLIFIMIFLQFIKVSPNELYFKKWHLYLLLIQGLSFVSLALISSYTHNYTFKVILESIMLCLICPTACAAGVITHKIGGSLSSVLSYSIQINLLASILISMMIPLIKQDNHLAFYQNFISIITKVFSMLIIPCFVAWIIKFYFKKLHKFLLKQINLAFISWAISLSFATILSTKSLISSHINIYIVLSIALISLICCLMQFYLGRVVARKDNKAEILSAGQSLGQKNTSFMIWLGFSFLSPVTSIAGGFYAIWHNMVSSIELREYQRKKAIKNQ